MKNKLKLFPFVTATTIALLAFVILVLSSCSASISSSESESEPEVQQFIVIGHGRTVDGSEFPDPGRSVGSYGLRATRLSDGYWVWGDCLYCDFRDFSFELTSGTWQIDATIDMRNIEVADDNETYGDSIALRATQTITLSASSPSTSEIVLYFAPPTEEE